MLMELHPCPYQLLFAQPHTLLCAVWYSRTLPRCSLPMVLADLSYILPREAHTQRTLGIFTPFNPHPDKLLYLFVN